MSDSLRELYQEIILEHAKHPRHFGPMAAATHQADGHNPLCGDKVRVYLQIAGERIARAGFEGKGCAISTASASLMTEIVEGRTAAEADALMQAFLRMAKGEPGEELVADDRERLEVLSGVREFPMRVKCATLPWHTMKAAIDGAGEPAKTE